MKKTYYYQIDIANDSSKIQASSQGIIVAKNYVKAYKKAIQLGKDLREQANASNLCHRIYHIRLNALNNIK
jgi:hypothetical protein